MLTKEDNELMCRVGPNTGMGAAIRRFWIPALLTSDLPNHQSDPRRVELLGETFVAFRDDQGRVGLLDELCCHRNASLVLGRVEGCGIRCIYHGWKFAVDGTVLETPNVPDPNFKARFKAKSYPVEEAGGIVWVYLGKAAEKPPLPCWAWFDVPEKCRVGAAAVIPCNYVQILEGLVDSSHLSVLHLSQFSPPGGTELEFAKVTSHMQFDATPRIEAESTDFGFHYCAMRQISDEKGERIEARVTAFLPPFFVSNPNKDLWFAVVPMNDERCLFYNIWFSPTVRFGEEPLRTEQLKFVGMDAETLARHGMTLDTYESDLGPSRANKFHQDRALLRRGHHTGLHSFTQEDVAVAASAGGIRDRSKEMLSIADVAIGMLYKTLLKCARQGRDGEEPIGLSADRTTIFGTHASLAPNTDWRTLVPSHRRPTEGPLSPNKVIASR
jgi:phthalate 4,5-dioxygenase